MSLDFRIPTNQPPLYQSAHVDVISILTHSLTRFLANRRGLKGSNISTLADITNFHHEKCCATMMACSDVKYLKSVNEYWLLHVIINNISDMLVTAQRCAGGLKKKLDLRSDSYAIDMQRI